MLGMLCVGFGIGGSWRRTESWPDMFGGFGDAWSIRNVWGKAWHQNLRRCLNAPGDRIAVWLFGHPTDLSPTKRLIRRYFLLFCAFGISGLLHALAVYFGAATNSMPYEDSMPISSRPGWYKTGYFFYIQAVVIMIEDYFCWILGLSTEGKRVKENPTRWLFGTVYTFTWFIWSTAILWIDPQLAALGYQRISDSGLGYIHILVSTSEAASVLPFNPWPLMLPTVISTLESVYSSLSVSVRIIALRQGSEILV
ncbi:hypothetical protein AA313_de0200831 [Arthrobotrys entomopaga]|nr:hypothetical protein AA313_de0200831 [Arthrobotrys entomopaga]